MSSHDFSSIIQLSREDIVRATDYCIGRLTAQALRPPAATARQAAACSTTVVRNSQRTSRADGIPRTCLLEDRDPLGPSLGLRVGYVNWFFRPVRACERHGQELVRRRHQHYSEQFQDLEIVAPDDGQLEREAGEGASLSVSPLQTYTERRFQGATGPSWLDGQMIDQAAKAC